MSAYTLDELYQCSLEEYAAHLGKSVDDLIEEKWREIELLQQAYDKLIERRQNMAFALLAKEIKGKEHSKRKTLEKFLKWRKKSCKTTK